jgi:hypothetical protein
MFLNNFEMAHYLITFSPPTNFSKKQFRFLEVKINQISKGLISFKPLILLKSFVLDVIKV